MSSLKIFVKPEDGKTYKEICDDVESGVTHTVIFRGVEFVKPKHGHWIDNKVAFHRVCSECRAVIRQDISLVYLLECMEKVGKLDYCPNCGAKMDEVEE